MTNLVYSVKDADGFNYDVFNINGKYFLVNISEDDCDEILETKAFATFSKARKYIKQDIEADDLAIRGYSKSDLKVCD